MALEEAHATRCDLFEDDEGGINAVYLDSWDPTTKRTVWRTLRSVHGLSPFDRRALPDELKQGTFGPDFEV